MRIAEAARRSGLSIDTIRYYEKFGLLPDIPRGADGQRRFSDKAIDWVMPVSALRGAGMPMKAMRRFADLYRQGDVALPERKAMSLAHDENLKQRRTALEQCEALLVRKLALHDRLAERNA